MNWILFCIGILQCLLIWTLGQAGVGLREKAKKEREKIGYVPEAGWPYCALIIPVAGIGEYTGKALRSFLDQNYDNYQVYLVTATDHEPAQALIDELLEEYNNVRHVVAGISEKCGQKNYNLLAGITKTEPDTQVYIFSDSSHIARADFLRCLVNPIARGEAEFSTGYHEVEPLDGKISTLGYALSVMFMRFLQGMSVFTQPWGGAMAMTRKAFEDNDIARLWATNVVDDCSLAAWLLKRKINIKFCAAAILTTFAHDHALKTWSAWLKRQILFLKFCIPGQWIGLGLISLWMILPPIWCGVCIIRGSLDFGNGTGPFLALCWLCLISLSVMGWQKFLPAKVRSGHWLWAFFCACGMFALLFAGTLWTRKITWQKITYQVGSGGAVIGIKRG